MERREKIAVVVVLTAIVAIAILYMMLSSPTFIHVPEGGDCGKLTTFTSFDSANNTTVTGTGTATCT